ncbi:FMN reductase [Mesorhizobium sp. 43Arga]
MTTPAIVGLSGSYNSPSRTRILVEEIVRRAARRYDKTAEILDIGQFPNLGTAVRLSDLNPTARRLVDRLLQAEALVVASPVYKGSYTGLFKHLIDLLEPTAFSGKPILLAATGGGDRHALVIEHQLRPLFGFFEAHTLATGIYASERDFADPASISPSLAERLERAIGQFEAYLEPRTSKEPSPRPRVIRANGSASRALGHSLSRIPLANLE